MADRDDAMDVGAIEDDALVDDEDDDQNENGDEVEAGYKMAKVSGYLHFSNEHRPEVTTRVNAMEGLAPRERSQKIIAELGKMWKALPEADRVSWKERAPIVKQKIKAKKPKLTVSDAATGKVISVPATELYAVGSTVSFDEEVTWEIPLDKRSPV